MTYLLNLAMVLGIMLVVTILVTTPFVVATWLEEHFDAQRSMWPMGVGVSMCFVEFAFVVAALITWVH